MPKITSVKLICHTCGEAITRQQSKSGKFTKNFCNERCMWNNRIRWIGYLVANYSAMKPKSIATHIGIPVNTFRTWVFCMNKMLLGYTKVVFSKGPERINDGLTNSQRSEKRQRERLGLKPIPPRPEKPKPIPLTQNNTIRLKSPNLESLGNRAPLPGNKPIYIAENDRVVTEVVPTYRGYILKH